MDLSSPRLFQPRPVFGPSDGVKEPALEDKASIYGRKQGNPFADSVADPLCELNLKETSDFVKSLPMASTEKSKGFLDVPNQRRREGANSVIQRRMEAPATPGRPVFGFTVSRKNFPSKWDDAEKWLVSSSCHDSPAHGFKPLESLKGSKQNVDNFKQQVEKLSLTDEKASSFQGVFYMDHHHNHGRASSGSSDVLLKDKFTDDVQPVFPKFRYSEPSREGFLFRNSASETMKDAGTEVIDKVRHRDVGTEMTPIASSTTSRCQTPFKIASPPRHNTPADRSGPLALASSASTNSTIDIAQLQECHLAKLQLGSQYDSITSNWSSREEEEEDISKSLRHFETGQKSVTESRAAAWEEEKTECCIRYQREEARIQAWVNLQTAKAEAQSRKLEVKIQKMRSNLEEKLMKRMAEVNRKAEEWRETARQQHSEQMRRATAHTQKMRHRPSGHCWGPSSCGCFPCTK